MLHVPAGALKKKVTIEIQHLDGKTLPPLPPGMMNVTKDGNGYRFLPAGQIFEKEINVSLPLIKTKTKDYWKTLGVRTYYWDPKAYEWKTLIDSSNNDDRREKLQRSSVTVNSRTKHFSVMINAILKSPEHAGPESFNENAISSIGAASPTENVDLIQPPEPSNKGTTDLSFPLRLPQGRGGYSPELSFRYSSQNENGPLGVGWDLPISKISVDTSSGVPHYDATDNYEINGIRLIAIESSPDSSCLRKRNSSEIPVLEREFALRIHQNQRILLCSNDTGKYWEVLEPNGVRYYYGIDAGHRIESHDSPPRVSSWLLQEVEDPNGNLTSYTYMDDDFAGDDYENISPNPVGVYLKQIDYTGHLTADASGNYIENISPAYRAELHWDCDEREDRIISSKMGFISKTRCRLDSVAVLAKMDDEILAPPSDNSCYQQQNWSVYKAVRCYDLHYGESAFDGKSLLNKIAIHGADGVEFYHHSFFYSEPESLDVAGNSLTAFSPPCQWQLEGIGRPLTNQGRPLDYTDETNHQLDLGAGYSFDACYVGGSTALSLELPDQELQFIDINGDGVLDRVWVNENQIRVALGNSTGSGGIFGIGAISGETRSYVKGINKIESQGAFGATQSGNVSCGNNYAGVGAGMSVSLRLSYSSAFLIDVDGDGLVDLMSGDSYYRGLPRVCRDGLPPEVTSGLCADGLEVCDQPQQYLCFAAASLSLSNQRFLASGHVIRMHSPVIDTDDDKGTDNQSQDLNNANVVSADLNGEWKKWTSSEDGFASYPKNETKDLEHSYKTFPVDYMSTAQDTLEAEDNWGPYTSARRRMEKEGISAATFEKLRPVIRWDAQHDGVIELGGRFSLPNKSNEDGVKVSIYLVWDPHREEGRVRLDEFILKKDAPVKNIAIRQVPVRFRWQLHFIFDPLDETPVTVRGVHIDKVISDLMIKYTVACPLNGSCRQLTSDEINNHRGPTGQLAYLYQYPDDFRTSELPKETYWKLMPPLGPPVVASDGKEMANKVGVEIVKNRHTASPVHVRVRCESVGSQHARDDHVCPMGTILEEVVLEADNQTEQRIEVPLPQTFLRAKDFMTISNYDCWMVHQNALAIYDRQSLGWLVAEGNRAIHNFNTKEDAEEFKGILEHYDYTCNVGPRPASENIVHGFLFQRNENPDASRDWEEITKDADCIEYSPHNLSIEEVESGKWLLRSGRTRLMMVSTQSEALKAKAVAENFMSLCFVGRGNTRDGTLFRTRHRDFVYEYFDSPYDQVYDPVRVMVEVDGENGVEIKPGDVSVNAKVEIASLHRLKQGDFYHRPPMLYKDILQNLTPDRILIKNIRPLFRVHPSRHLQAFTPASNSPVKLKVRTTSLYHNRPIYLMLTGESFEGSLLDKKIMPPDIEAGELAVSGSYEVTIPPSQTYYLRVYTEASFDPFSRLDVTAEYETCIQSSKGKNCFTKPVPVNLLKADFSYPYRAGPDNNPVMNTYSFDNVVGEVAHSFEPFSGGHHGFFYGIIGGNLPPKCLVPFNCGKKLPEYLQKTGTSRIERNVLQEWFSGAEKSNLKKNYENLPLFSMENKGSQLPVGIGEKSLVIGEQKAGPQVMSEVGIIKTTDHTCWIEVQLASGTIMYRDSDSDGDGICDSKDPCKSLPEDHLGDNPDDGCPAFCASDADSDTINDCLDVCPYQPADLLKYPYSDGCPVVDENVTNDPGYGPEPVDNKDSGGGGTGGGGPDTCYTSAGFNSSICNDGSTNPGHENSSGSSSDFGFSLGDGMRRTWTLGISQSVNANILQALSGNVSASLSAQYTDRDVRDWNGDGIIDFVSPNIISLGGINRSVSLDNDCYLPLGDECLIYPGVQEAISISLGAGVSIGGQSIFVLKTDSNGNAKEQAVVQKSEGGGMIRFSSSTGVSGYLNHSSTISQRIDINGDGLPDQIFGHQNGRDIIVRFNQGDKFSEEIPYKVGGSFSEPAAHLSKQMNDLVIEALNRAPIGQSDTFTRSVPWTVGGGGTIYGFGGSAYYSENDSNSLTVAIHQFLDMNGDGLIDIVMRYPGDTTIQVAFNMGDHFKAPVVMNVPSWVQHFNANEHIGGLTGNILSSLPDYPDPLSLSDSDTFTWSGSTSGSFYGFTATSGYAYTDGRNRNFLTMQDMDADGIPDRVQRLKESDGSVWVSRGLLGRANLLTKIERPFGGVIDLEYELMQSSEEQPRAKWVLSAIKLDQSELMPAELRSSPIHTQVHYENSYYDRYEKADLGFGKVTIEQIGQGEGESRPSIKRKIERTFYNRDYWLRGVLKNEKIIEADNRLLKETITEHDSKAWPGMTARDMEQCLDRLLLPQRYLNTVSLRSLDKTPCDVRSPRLLKTTVNNYEGGTTPLIYHQEIQEYDDYGNPSKVVEEYGGAEEPIAIALVEYDQRTGLRQKYIVDKPTDISIRKDSETGMLLRLRKGEYDDNGNLTRHEVWADLTGTKVAGFEIQPDATGFVEKVTDSNGYQLEFVPDGITHSLVVEVDDNFGLTSKLSYDYRFQLPLKTTDINGNSILRSYDQFGRLEALRGPYESAADVDTISIDYPMTLHGSYPVRAITTNTSVNPETRQTATTLQLAQFADGLGRIIQTQTQTEVGGVMGRTISSHKKYDYAGRIICSGHPQFVTGPTFIYQNKDCDIAPFTITNYDALDRMLSQSTQSDDPSGGDITTTWAYSVQPYPGDQRRTTRQTLITDPEGKVKEQYFDARERLVAVNERIGSRDLVTRYDYSAVSDLLKITDAHNNIRTFEYDLAGQRTSIVSPDTGRLEYEYDSMGNLVKQIDQELCDTTPPLLTNSICQTKIIVREYDKNRLIKIDYPDSQDVTFTYGDHDPNNLCASLNTKGKICHVEDGGGTETISYGALGEVVGLQRKVTLDTTPAIYNTSFLYESFGRLLSMTYPDGEILSYGYDMGGRVKLAKGIRNGVDAIYVSNRQYDVYGKVLSTDFGNGVTETNEYYANTQRLHRRVVHRGDVLLSSLELVFDMDGNILSSTSERGEGHAIANIARAYTYDDLHRLDAFTVDAGGVPEALNITGGYDYDDVGNITRQQLTYSGPEPNLSRDWAYAYDHPSRPNLPSTIGPFSFTYDNRGSTRTFTQPDAGGGNPQISTYRWNEEGVLTRVETSTMNSEFVYDSEDGRVWRRTIDWGDSASTVTEITHYPSPYYSAWLKEVRPSGCSAIDCSEFVGSRTKHIRLDGQIIASVQCLVDAGTVTDEQSIDYLLMAPQYVHTDQVSSTSTITGETGLAEQVFEYLPFGEVVEQASSNISALKNISGFNGMELDLETGLQYFGGRYYQPNFGRWMSADPNCQFPENTMLKIPAFFNLYSFSLNNPGIYYDPDGARPTPLLGDQIAVAVKKSLSEPNNAQIYGMVLMSLRIGGVLHVLLGQESYADVMDTITLFEQQGIERFPGQENDIEAGENLLLNLLPLPTKVAKVKEGEVLLHGKNKVLITGSGRGTGAMSRGPRVKQRFTPGRPPNEPTLEQIVTPIGTHTSKHMPGTMKPAKPWPKAVLDFLSTMWKD